MNTNTKKTKKYIVILRDKKKETLKANLLNQHVNHLRALTQLGKLFLCGPFKNDDGAIQIIVAETKEEAERIIKQDPFVKEKYYQSYAIHELIEANENNNWLCENTQTKINMRNENKK